MPYENRYILFENKSCLLRGTSSSNPWIF